MDIRSRSIFIMGKAGAGKDTAAEMLRDYFSYEPFTLADNIRDEFLRFFPDLNPRLCREKLIEIGQSYKRLYGDDVWVMLMSQDINSFMQNENRPVVITDGRYQIEYDFYVRKLGYTPVRIHCDDEVRFERLLKRDGTLQKEALAKESTELELADAFIIDNSYETECTLRQIKDLVKKMKHLER